MNAMTEKMTLPHGRGYVNDSLDEELEYLWDDCDASGKSYAVFLGKISRSPIVKSKSSGKYFMLPWSQIIKQATKLNIDL